MCAQMVLKCFVFITDMRAPSPHFLAFRALMDKEEKEKHQMSAITIGDPLGSIFHPLASYTKYQTPQNMLNTTYSINMNLHTIKFKYN